MQLRDLFSEALPQEGSVIPLALQQLLREDLDVREDWREAERLLLRAREAMPDNLDVLVALYKLYAYSNRFEDSLAVIRAAQTIAARLGSFDADWRRLGGDSAPWYPAQGAVRHYLYSMKATGFVSLRRGDIDTAFAVLAKLAELDPRDQVGGSVVLEMAQSLQDDQEHED